MTNKTSHAYESSTVALRFVPAVHVCLCLFLLAWDPSNKHAAVLQSITSWLQVAIGHCNPAFTVVLAWLVVGEVPGLLTVTGVLMTVVRSCSFTKQVIGFNLDFYCKGVSQKAASVSIVAVSTNVSICGLIVLWVCGIC